MPFKDMSLGKISRHIKETMKKNALAFSNTDDFRGGGKGISGFLS